MPSAAYYRREAERARAAAENSNDAETVMRWRLRIAKDYQTLADALTRAEPKLPAPPVPTQPHPQPLQQQQGELGTDDPVEC